MKKNSTVATNRKQIFKEHKLTIGLDLGDRSSYYCVLDEAGEVILEHNLPTTPKGIQQVFSKMPRSRVALETGTAFSLGQPAVGQLGHEVIVAHARNVRLIGESSRKDDRLDARTLARLARIDPGLLGPVRHRSAKAQIHLTVIRARAALVSTRTALVNAARGLAKSYGERLQKCGTEQVNRDIAEGLSQELRDALDPLLARNRIAERAHRGIRSADRTDRHGSASRSGSAETSEGCGNTDRVDLRADSGRSTPISAQPRCGMFSGAASWAQELRQERAATAHQQGRRPLPANAAGAGRALHSGAVWTGQRSAALGTEARRARRKECQETSGGCCGAEAGRAAAQVVGERRGL